MKKVEVTLKIEFQQNENHDTDSFFKLFCKAYRICVHNVNFMWDCDQYFVPTSGDYNILGVTVEIKQYDWMEFLEIIHGHEVILHFNQYPNFEEDILCMGNYPSEIKYFPRIDYPSTITRLEMLGLVKTKPSVSFLSTDGRSFCIVEKDVSVETEWYEVDILGTPYGKDIADVVFQLYQRENV